MDEWLWYLAAAVFLMASFAFEYFYRKKNNKLSFEGQRVQGYDHGLRKMIESGQESIRFTSNGPKSEYVQFTQRAYLTLEIEGSQLDSEAETRLEQIIPPNDKTLHSGGYTYKVYFNKKQTQKAAKYAERVFREVFQLPPDYQVK